MKAHAILNALSAIGAASRRTEKMNPLPGESLAAFAERLYKAHVEIFEIWLNTKFPKVTFDQLGNDDRETWFKLARKRKNSAAYYARKKRRRP